MKKLVMVLILVMFLAGCKESLLEKDKTKARDFSRAVHDSNYVKDSKAIHSSDYVEDSEAIYSSDHVYWGEAIYSSYYTQSCNGLS